ncbi:AraC family transcriptional regulator [Pseudomonas palleroniana]|uniref:AraC family transcriptional regulator n=1 Tax=Pseudomonas palleroniana TaxID=191390 RepID=A0A2L1JJ73_9PSED|nr:MULTISPECIES: AraC family transcriptional regulator [Pseudomonas]AVE08518.1 AraC family transcriptional regulator [Pseudomonas palleroniana]MBI6907366.1 helix-turn-helix transcriptional regulator [Pseudomonas palleroniana]NCE82973.1 AraC family transcriptional regulator [Pseudomonas sp. Q1]UOK38387.1 AraC family transcriptional regulator [Pseudomonas palleroniana]
MNMDKSTVLATLTLASTEPLKSWQISTAKQLMLGRLDTGISVTELAEACALSRSHFTRMFKESTRMPPQRWLREQRVMKSRELLKTSTMLLTEIALECGFSDQSHFCRTFVKTVGMTPTAWQRQAVCPTPVVA